MSLARPRLAMTLGDCAGIGPELVLRVLTDPAATRSYAFVVFGSLAVLRRVSLQTGIPVPASLRVVSHGERLSGLFDGGNATPVWVDLPFDASAVVPGIVQSACGAFAYDMIRAAADTVMSGNADALVTAPVNKEALHLAGVPFPGHTEMLASLTGSHDPCMAFYTQGLMISLATIHEALADVPRLLSVDGLTRVIRLTHAACRTFGIATPRIGVLALNPHAGENGLFGQEEKTVIEPAIRQLRAEAMNLAGPIVPDTAFTGLTTGGPLPYDAYVAMYHDQGLIPFKMVAFDTGVNVTLGLPIIRTSPDHGTAFNIAWQGKASAGSLFSAVELAARMATARVGMK